MKPSNHLQKLIAGAGPIKRVLTLSRLRNKYVDVPPQSHVDFLGYRVKITDGLNFYIQYKDEFIQQIYHFESSSTNPLIIDGGSNIGMSILYFKRLYPNARIVGFEP